MNWNADWDAGWDAGWQGDADVSDTSRRPGFQDTAGNRNKRENRYGAGGKKNDTAYRLGENDRPHLDVADNKNRNRFT